MMVFGMTRPRGELTTCSMRGGHEGGWTIFMMVFMECQTRNHNFLTKKQTPSTQCKISTEVQSCWLVVRNLVEMQSILRFKCYMGRKCASSVHNLPIWDFCAYLLTLYIYCQHHGKDFGMCDIWIETKLTTLHRPTNLATTHVWYVSSQVHLNQSFCNPIEIKLKK